MSKIIGATVGTPISPKRLHDKLNFVKTINHMAPDANGNVEIEVSGGNVDQNQIEQAVANYLTQNPVAGGMTKTEKNLILQLFRNAAYISGGMNPAFTQLETLWNGSGEGGGDVHSHSYTSSITTAATCTTAGVRTYTCSCGHSYTETIPATGHNYVNGVCTVCGAADPNYEPDTPDVPEVTLTSISATYSGGDVAVGTAVSDLTGIVVTAHYSDGSSATVTGYNLSGTIAEGNNIITVSYGGKTTTFMVTGVAESGGSDAVNLYSGSYVKHSGLTNVEINGNVISYDAPALGTATFTIEGLEAGKQYTIFVESNRADSGGQTYTQCTVNKANGAVYTEQLVKFNVDWPAAGPNYATFTASSAMMYFWCCESTAKSSGYPGSSDITLTVYIYEGTLTERP